MKLLLTLIAALLLCAAPALAQSGFSLDRNRVDMAVIPGQTQEFRIGVVNNGTERRTYTIEIEDFLVVYQGGKEDVALFPGGTIPRSAAPVIVAKLDTLQLDGGAKGSFVLQASAPTGAGTHWVQAFVRQGSPAIDPKAGVVSVNTEYRLGIPVFVTRAGTERSAGTLEKAQITATGLKVGLVNTGNTLLEVNGRLSLLGLDGKVISRQDLKPTIVAYPDGRREKTFELPKIAAGQYLILLEAEVAGRLFTQTLPWTVL
jgi:hypothetical protein